jgi:hypothetical protein
MSSEGLWAIGMLIAIGYGIYRLWKKLTKDMHEAIKKNVHIEWKCTHDNEPNHDRIACANSTATVQILSMLGVMWVFSRL